MATTETATVRRRACDAAARKRAKRREHNGSPREPHELAVRMHAGLIGAVIKEDRNPRGSFTPRGSRDGCSTGYEDLAAELDELAGRAAADPFWRANPDVFAGL